jgi:predicted enzyme related to lactoylglutathione lyase
VRIKRVAFTIQPVADVARARAFYEQTLGLEPGLAGGQGDMCWIEYDLPGGGCLALTNTTGDAPSDSAGATVALEVDDLDALIAELTAAGVRFRSEVVRGPRCRMAMCLDSEGNSILLHQLDADE